MVRAKRAGALRRAWLAAPRDVLPPLRRKRIVVWTNSTRRTKPAMTFSGTAAWADETCASAYQPAKALLQRNWFK
jgi:hypothetical protein